MSNVEITIAGLVKNNNGLYKSDAQKSFLLSQVNYGKDSIVFGKVKYKNHYKIIYSLDDKGIYKVTNYSDKKGTEKVEWEREEEGKTTVQQQKLIKQYVRRIKEVEKSIAKRDQAYQNGEYEGCEELYKDCNAIDKELLAGLKQKMSEL